MHAIDRRQFLQTAALAGAAAAAPALAAAPETLVGELYRSLSAEQKSQIAFDFDHPLRHRVENNWHITPAKVSSFFNADQRGIVQQIFLDLHNPEFSDQVVKQLTEDTGGVGNCSVALFGEPGSGKFEFVITGRHLTARCDGDSVDGAAFGGPIFYGHQGMTFTERPDHPNNVYWFQAKRANEVFQMLDGKQRQAALLGRSRKEQGVETVRLKKPGQPLEGLPVAEMSPDQREMVAAVLADLLHPFREADRSEAMKHIRANGGLEALAMAFYKDQDLGEDGVWDVWQLESPTMIWHFRGAPHIHVWVNIQANPGWEPVTS